MTAEDEINLQTEDQIFPAQSSKNYLFSMYWVIVGLLSKYLDRTIPFIRLNSKSFEEIRGLQYHVSILRRWFDSFLCYI